MNRKHIHMYMVLGMIVLILLIACSKVMFDRTIDIENEFQVVVVMPADSKYELDGVIHGINDNAREKNIKINMLYASDWDKEQLENTILEERSMGSKAVFIIYPEQFIREYEDVKLHTYLPSLVLNDKAYKNNVINAGTAYYDGIEEITAEHIKKADVYRLMTGETDELIVPAEYYMGYYCIDNLMEVVKRNTIGLILPVGGDYYSSRDIDNIMNKRMDDVCVPVLRITRKDVIEGKFHSILEDR